MTNVTLYFPKKQMDKIDLLANQWGISRYALLTQMIDEALLSPSQFKPRVNMEIVQTIR